MATSTAAAAGAPRDPDDIPWIDRRWFATLSSLLYAFGWLLIPGAGWVIGVLALLLCSAWTREQKKTAVVAPLIAAAVVGGGIGLWFRLAGAPTSAMATWTVLVAGVFAGGVVSAVLGTRLCVGHARTRAA